MKTITIQRTDGTYSNEKAKAIFVWVDPDIESYDCSGNDEARPETIAGYERLGKDGTFVEIFGTEPKTFTKAQVIDIVNNHSDALNKKGYENFFPYRNPDGKYFVLYVFWSVSEWFLRVRRLEDDYVWGAEIGRVVFLPQQATFSPEPYGALPENELNPDERIAEAVDFLKSNGFRVYKTEEVTTEY